jgi:antitoxin ParD1/3/4
MTVMNITLPEPLKAFLDEQVAAKGLGSVSDYLRDLVEKEQDRERLRAMILEGENSPMVPVDDAFFAELRQIARGRDQGEP